MSTATRAAAFAVGLVLVFAVALGVGRLIGPVDGAPQPMAGHAEDHTSSPDPAGAAPEVAPDTPGGLQVSEEGYTLTLEDPTAPRSGTDQPVRFAITGPDGAAVTAYDVAHDKRLHLIALGRDLSGYQHVHPTLADDGTWTARLTLVPGTMRLFADFVATGGPDLTLGADLQVPGDVTPVPATEPSRTSRADDYRVTLDGDLVAGQPTTLTAHVEKRGRPVTDLQPYLGAHGHLVALREGDLAYLHVHPEEGPPGPDVSFTTTLPSPGRYRLFLDFRHGDAVRTAGFTVVATSGQAADRPDKQEEDSHDH